MYKDLNCSSRYVLCISNKDHAEELTLLYTNVTFPADRLNSVDIILSSLLRALGILDY
jgi:hypothetical protein